METMEVGPLNNNRRWICVPSKCNPVETTLPCLGAAVNKNSHRTLDGIRRKHRSRSSPVRSGLTSANNPVRRARSPSTSALRSPIPHAPAPITPHSNLYNRNTDAQGAVAFYAPHPPSTPVYLVPLATNPVPDNGQIFDPSKQKQKTKIKESKRVARHIVRSILGAVTAKITARAESHGGTVFACNVGASMTTKDHLYRSIASQTKPLSPTRRSNAIDDEDDVSSLSEQYCLECDEGCEWAGDVRALRDSHVRLMLRQLRQLHEIERLNRTLRRTHATPTSRTANLSHFDDCSNALPASL